MPGLAARISASVNPRRLAITEIESPGTTVYVWGPPAGVTVGPPGVTEATTGVADRIGVAVTERVGPWPGGVGVAVAGSDCTGVRRS